MRKKFNFLFIEYKGWLNVWEFFIRTQIFALTLVVIYYQICEGIF